MLVELQLTFLTEDGDVGFSVYRRLPLTCIYTLLPYTKSKCQFGFKNKRLQRLDRKGGPCPIHTNSLVQAWVIPFSLWRDKSPTKKHNQNKNPLIVFQIRIAQKHQLSKKKMATFSPFSLPSHLIPNTHFNTHTSLFFYPKSTHFQTRVCTFSSKNLALFFKKSKTVCGTWKLNSAEEEAAALPVSPSSTLRMYFQVWVFLLFDTV